MSEKKEQKYTMPNTYGQRITDAADAYMNRDGFSYDPNTDQTFQDYAAAMKKNGALAMEDTVGKAASMTGGYGNSYAETVGQQVYNNYMDTINEKSLEFRQQALNEYNAEGDQLRDNLSLLLGLQENENSNYLTNLELEDKEKAEIAEKEASEREKAYAIAQATGKWDDYYSKYLGMTKDQITTANEKTKTDSMIPLDETAITGAINAAKEGRFDSYFEYLTKQGYNTDGIYNVIQDKIDSGELSGDDVELIWDKDKEGNDVIVGVNSKNTNYYKIHTNDAINDAIGGIDSYDKGENFYISRTEKDHQDWNDWDVQIGDEVSDDDPVKEKARHIASNKVFLYQGNIYLKGTNGNVYIVEAQATRGDEWTKLYNALGGN